MTKVRLHRSQRAPDRRLQILFFDDRHYAAQGAQKLLVQLAVFAREAGIEATVGSTRDGTFLNYAREAGLPVTVLGVPDGLDKFEGALVRDRGSALSAIQALWKQNRSLARQIRRDQYDVVWAAALRPLLSLVRMRVASRVPLVWQIMGSARFPILSEIASLLSTRIVMIAEGLRPTVGRLADMPGVRGKIRVVETGLPVPTVISSTKSELRLALSLPQGSESMVWLISLGAHISDKGHLDVVQAFLALPEETRRRALLLIGGPPLEGTYRDRLLGMASESDNIVVQGWVTDVDSWLRAADIYVLASRREGMPLTMVEAMQRRAACIGYPVGGVPELIHDGVTGCLVDAGDIAGLRGALQMLIENDSTRITLGESGHEHVMANNTEEVMAAKFRAVVEELLQGRKRISR